MLRIAVHNTDPEHPNHALFQVGEPFTDPAIGADRLLEVTHDFAPAAGFVAVVQELVVDNPDAEPEEQTATWTDVAA